MIAVDTNILIWGLDRTATAGIEHRLELAARFLRYLTENKIEVIIPAQVLAEFLVRNTPDERDEALRLIDPNFLIAPLDFAAAWIAAELTSNRAHTDEVRATFGRTRQQVKADANVLASAINYGATKLISGNEREMRALAQGRIIVQSLEEFVAKEIDAADVPPRADGRQLDLPGCEESRDGEAS